MEKTTYVIQVEGGYLGTLHISAFGDWEAEGTKLLDFALEITNYKLAKLIAEAVGILADDTESVKVEKITHTVENEETNL